MIRITKTEGGYTAEATPPHVREAWRSDGSQSVRFLFDELRARGAHQTDIGDAFYEADPNWLK